MFHFDCAKAPGLNRSKMTPYYNIGSFPIVQSRELSRGSNVIFVYAQLLLQCFFFTLTLLLAGCSWRPLTPEYSELYAHLMEKPNYPAMLESDYFVVLLVAARHLDYTHGVSTLKTIAKHPSDGSKNGDVGHAWIYLQGIEQGERVFIEGGHSGERGINQSRYFEGVMNYIEYGYATPTEEQIWSPRYEPNPIKYLWATQRDGFFQWGSGGHTPTFAAKIDLTKEQFQRIVAFIHSSNYYYKDYALIHNQCSSFVAKVAALANLPIDHEVTISIPPTLSFRDVNCTLWTDPHYAKLTFSSPDIVERSLMQAVRKGHAQYALPWYFKHHGRCWCMRFLDMCEDIRRFPNRFCRVFL
jgi:hypothetical protein